MLVVPILLAIVSILVLVFVARSFFVTPDQAPDPPIQQVQIQVQPQPETQPPQPQQQQQVVKSVSLRYSSVLPRFVGVSKDAVVSKLLQTYPNFAVVPIQFGQPEPADRVPNRLLVTYDEWTGRVVSIQNR